jgi:hypothetical protein
MNHLLNGFACEMQKLSKETTPYLEALREVKLQAKADDDVAKVIKEIAPEKSHGRNYASSAGFGAMAVPALSLVSAAVRRKVGNLALKRQFGKAKTIAARKAIAKKLERGPLMSAGDVAGSAARGALMGGLVQAGRDYVMDGTSKKG